MIGLVCFLSLAMIYAVLQYRRRSLILKQNEKQDDKEKGPAITNNLDDLFKSTANDDDKFVDDVKSKSKTDELDQRTAKVQGFLMRAMTLPQTVLQTVGKIQTIQITEPSANVEQSIQTNKNINQQNHSSNGNSPTGNSSLINTTCTPTQVERPANLKNRSTAPVKSPSSNYLKKSPSPTGQKTPPQQTANENSTDKSETSTKVLYLISIRFCNDCVNN